MFESFSGRPPFAQWQPEVLRDYCEYGLLPAGTEFELACPPLVEASIYPLSVAPESNLHGELETLTQPVVVVRGGIPWSPEKFDLSSSPTDPELASFFPHGRDVPLPGRSHFIPMEIPDWVAGEIAQIDYFWSMSLHHGDTEGTEEARRNPSGFLSVEFLRASFVFSVSPW